MSAYDSLTLDEVLAQLKTVHASILASGLTEEDGEAFWAPREVQSGLMVAAHRKGATRAQIQATL
jgi:hypothetical protein